MTIIYWSHFLHFYIFYTLAEINIKNVNNTRNSQEERVINCALEIANSHFDYSIHTTIFYNDIQTNTINNFLTSYKGSVKIETKGDAAPSKQVIIIVETFHSFVKKLSILKPDIRSKTLLNGDAKFLIIILSNPKRLDRITSILWSFYVTNVLIITGNKKNVPTLYSYFPYVNHLNCQNTKPIVIGICYKNMTHKDIFPHKMSNMNGCPLYISTDKLYYASIEQNIPLQIIKKALLRIIREKMNFTPIISNKDYISMDSYRAQNWSDSLNDVLSGQANISTCSIPLSVAKSGLFDYSTPYFRIRFGWIAPPITTGPILWRLLSPLNGYLWLILLAVITFVNSIPIICNVKSIKAFGRRFFKNFSKLRGVILGIWGVLMGQPIRVTPREFRDFYIVSLWLWFSFVIRSAYQSMLIVALKTDTMVGMFVSLKETVDHGLRHGGRAGFLTYFEYDPLIREKFEIIPDEKFDDIFWDVVEGRQKLVVATSLEYAWAYCFSRGKKEDECGQVLLDSIMTVPIVIWMKRNSPFTKSLSIWLPRIIESGLLNKEITISPTIVTLKSSNPMPLTLKQFASCMLCLLIGLTFSTVIFVIEIVTFKVIQYRRKKRIRFTL